jgi:SAM-dependent methyltransferase
VRDYQRYVRRLLARETDRREAMSQAVGGGYDAIGDLLRGVLTRLGLKAGDTIIDVGCGSGRLASALYRAGPSVSYLGTDVVPELLAYARECCPDPAWRFVQVDGLAIPEADGVADLVVFFSVMTHLTSRESDAYLADAKRVLKPGGQIVVSYIDPAALSFWPRVRFEISYLLHLSVQRAFKSVLTSKAEMERRAARAGLTVEFLGPIVGQNVCVFRQRGAILSEAPLVVEEDLRSC